MSSTKTYTNPFFITENNFFDVWGRHIKPIGFAVYSCLQRHANQGSCFPSHKRIAELCGISRDSVIRNLKLLVDFNLITIENRHTKAGGKTSNLYFINEFPPNPNNTPTPIAENNIATSIPATSHVAETAINNTKINEIKVDKTKFNKKTTDDITHARSNENAKVVETSSSVNFVKDKEPTDILDKIIYPQGLKESQPILKELSKLPNSEAAQQVLNVYASKDNIRNPVGLIRVLVKNYLADDFTPIDKPRLANDLKITPIEEETICPFCNGNGILWTKNSLNNQNRIKCNHNESYILNKLKQDESCIQGTKYDFRIKKICTPPPQAFKDLKNSLKKTVNKKANEINLSSTNKAQSNDVLDQLPKNMTIGPIVIPNKQELLQQINARVKIVKETERKKKAMIFNNPANLPK